MSSQSIAVEISRHQLVVEMPPKELLQLEAQVSVVSPSQIALLEKIRDDSESARDRAIVAETESANSASHAANSEATTLYYLNQTTDLHDNTALLHEQTEALHDDTERLHGLTSDLHSQTSDLTDQAKASADASEASSESSADSAAASMDSADQSATSAMHSEVSRQASDDSAAAAKTSETNSKASETSASESASESSSSADESKSQAEASATSAAESLASSEAAADSQAAALSSQEASKASETASANSATAAAQSADESETSNQASAASAEQSGQSADDSGESARASEQSAQEALASQEASKASETAAAGSASASSDSADESAGSAEDAADSQAAALASQTASKTSETNAKSSESASAESAAEALASQQASKTSETNAKASETNSAESAEKALSSETKSSEYAATAQSAKTDSETARDLSRKWATEAEDVPVEGNEFSSLHWAKVAERFAGTLTGGMYFAGQWDLGDGLPDPPEGPQVPWYRVVDNEVSRKERREFRESPQFFLWVHMIRQANKGDQLVWDPVAGEWFLIDTSDEVWLVNDKKGNVVLDAEDVGAYPKTELYTKTEINQKNWITSSDTRDDDHSPEDAVRGISYDFKKGETVGINGLYAGVITLKQWHNESGGSPTQIGHNGRRLYIRTALSEWENWSDNWYEFYHTGNKPDAEDVGALPLSGGYLTGNITFTAEGAGLQTRAGRNLIREVATDNDGVFVGNSKSPYVRIVAADKKLQVSTEAGSAGSLVYHEDNKPTPEAIGAVKTNTSRISANADTGFRFRMNDLVSAGWARGVYFDVDDNADGRAAFGFLGTANKVNSFHVGEGDWWHTGCWFSVDENGAYIGRPTNNDRLYSRKDPPTASDIGAKPDSYVPGWEEITSKPSTFPPATHSHSDYVVTTRTINGNPLSADVTLEASDVGALSSSGNVTRKGILTLESSDHSPLVIYRTSSTENVNIEFIKQDFVELYVGFSVDRNLFAVGKSADQVLNPFQVNVDTGEVTISGDKVYYPGNKPTAADIGARPDDWFPTWDNVSGKPSTATRWPQWGEVTEKPSTFTPSAHEHEWADVISKPAQATRWPKYDEVTEKPSTFPPSSHSHSWESVTDKPSSFPPSSHEHAWSQVTDKPAQATRWPKFDEVTDRPSTYPPATHNHDDDYAAKSHTHSEYAIPAGLVAMFAGTESQVPSGWQLCNGSGETSNGIKVPDLRDRFIVGAGSNHDPGDTGGSSSGTTSSGGSHDHTITVSGTTLTEDQIPSHKHGGSLIISDIDESIAAHGFSNILPTVGTYRANISQQAQNRLATAWTSSIGGSGSHSHSASSNSDGSHTHTVDIMPSYYALAYIIKL